MCTYFKKWKLTVNVRSIFLPPAIFLSYVLIVLVHVCQPLCVYRVCRILASICAPKQKYFKTLSLSY